MNTLKMLACAIALLVVSMSHANSQTDRYYGGFDGRWEGQMSHISLPAFDNPKAQDYADAGIAFTINGRSVKVYFKSPPNGSWSELKPGGFQILVHKTNAIIFSITSSEDINDSTGSGGWVETWSFTLTHKDENGLYVVATRAVNDYLRPYDHVYANGGRARLFRLYSGELSKVP